MQTLPEQLEVEREYDQQLQRTTSKGNTPLRLQVELYCQHGAPIYLILSLTHTFLFDFGGQKLDNYYDLFVLALFENIRLFVLQVENYSIQQTEFFVFQQCFMLLCLGVATYT